MKSPHRILIVEDVVEMQIFLESILAASGEFDVVGLAGNGGEARVIFERKLPEWVLLDELLPGESSFDLLKEFRTRGARVILMSGLGSDSAAGRLIPHDAVTRISKPEWDDPGSRARNQAGLTPEAWLAELLSHLKGA